MFVAEALADFSAAIMNASNNAQASEQQRQKQEQLNQKQPENDSEQKELKSKKRGRTHEQNVELERQLTKKQPQQSQQKKKKEEQTDDVKYIQFKTGEKILVQKTFQNGWWFGHPVGKPDQTGFFPSNYVKIGAKPPAPPPPAKNKQKKSQDIPQFDPNEGTDWIKKQLDEIKSGPVHSQYYQGIKGYKMVKIDQKNQNILKGNHVQFDVATGIARVPVKDQAPTAKAVRQMGYYFDYHQWNQTLNSNPQKKARPDPRKKKPKKLNLKMMD